MMMAPQVVGVLLKKPGQQQSVTHLPRIPPLDPQETKIRGTQAPDSLFPGFYYFLASYLVSALQMS
jgi:hypothetical protein